ncbi:MAG: cytochrome c3 family protein [Elusimicrobia bacterium]|nr:cytochrome c3 family protein [Elusimicrobiota bacterium]
MLDFPDLDRLAGTLWDGLRDPLGRVVLVATATGASLIICCVGWVAQPDRFARGFAPAQPIPFSHRLHAGSLAIPCLHCHPGAEKSRAAGIPSVEACMGCHKVTKTDSPAIRRLAAAFASGQLLAWKRVYSLPSHVFFDHRPHVLAGVACQTCHGPVQEMAVMTQHMSMRMANCLACHRDPRPALPAGSTITRAPENCNACHR